MSHVSHAAVGRLFIAAFVAAIFGIGAAANAGDQSADPVRVSPADQIVVALQTDFILDDETLRVANVLEVYRTTRSRKTIAAAIEQADRRGSAAAHTLMLRLAWVIGDSREEERVCDTLELCLNFDAPPEKLRAAIVSRWQRDAAMPFAAARCAAVLLKFWADEYPARQWLEERLQDGNAARRLTALMWLRSVRGAKNMDEATLRALLGDESWSLRVAAAFTLLESTAEPGPQNQAIDVLLESLGQPEESFWTRPLYHNAEVPSHRYVAAGALGRVPIRRDEAATAAVRLVDDEDTTVQLAAVRSLVALSTQSEQGLTALRRVAASDDHIWREEALRALKRLSK